MSLKPIGLKLKIYPLSDSSMMKSGLIIQPDSVKARMKTDHGIIVGIGPNVPDGLFTIGDHICYPSYAGDKLTLHDEGTFIFLLHTAVSAKIVNGSNPIVSVRKMKEIIHKRFSELVVKNDNLAYLIDLERDLIDRLNSITISEGFEE